MHEKRQLPPILPYPAPGTDPRDKEAKYLDPIDVIAGYDQAVVDMFRIPLVPKGVQWPRFYSKEDLAAMSVQQLRILATTLTGVDINDATDNKDLLIKGILFGQQIPVVFASPSPAYSAQELVTGRKEGSPMASNIRYPIISVQRLSIGVRDNSFLRAPYRMISWVGNDQAVIQGFKPNGILLRYQVECLSTLQTHMNIMDSWVFRMWNFPVVLTYVDLGQPWGIKQIQVLKESSYADQTEYEMDASVAEKMVRHIHTINVEGWMPTPVWTTPTVLRFTAGYYDMSTGLLLEGGEEEVLNQT